jgi:CheY-like chemotaxis protein
MPKKILVIDDDELNLKLVKSRLEASGYEVSTANDGDVGVQKLLKEKADLIILDVQMPRMNGYTFMLEFRKYPEVANTPVIVLTAHEEMQPIFTLKGVRGYLVKPIKFELLFEKLNALLGPPGAPVAGGK